ncbi:MAG: hypothetical protein M3068_04345 [Gemmatimonadota bacterium]|nr:hypothetical protein [Gemmatimonadota bacterium]
MRPDSVRAAATAESVATARDEWNEPEVVKRLAEAGLVVSDSGRRERDPRFHPEGIRLGVSGADLLIFLYPDSRTRARESARIDSASAIALPPERRPRYILVNNLIAILVTPRELLAERVTNALTARHASAP